MGPLHGQLTPEPNVRGTWCHGSPSRLTALHAPLVSVALLACAVLVGCRGPKPQREPAATVRGHIARVQADLRELRLRDTTGASWTVVLTGETRAFGEHGEALGLLDLFPQFEITATGAMQDSGILLAETISVTRAPNVVLSEPGEDDTLTALPLRIAGYARVFEHTVQYRISTVREGIPPQLVGTGFTTAQSADVGRFGRFRIEWYPARGDLTSLDADRLLVEVFSEDARDGTEINLVARTVSVDLPRAVYLYFPNRLLDPSATDCSRVYPVKRSLPQPIRAFDILSALVAGPSESEKEQGYATSLPNTARVAAIRIAGGIAYVDFASLDAAGSCRVVAIRAQIERTLLANLRASAVVISLRGEMRQALQP